ncbi:hypothetical protein LIER_35018 [Lithospermum erythrorhizon]|uniref:Uncharacterized protein n=1 Tax=Lithospermum erythrorhizon TaxID=34254 RepID=A0AAV3NI76_LITER
MSEETIPFVVGKETSHEIRKALYITLANPSLSSHLCLQEQLINLKQHDQSIASYLKQAKVTYDALAAISKQPPQEVFILYILCGLKEEYRDMKNTIFFSWFPNHI